MTQNWVSSQSVARLAWEQVTPVTSTTGVDFVLAFSEPFPMLLSEDRPLRMVSTLSQGNP